MPLLEINDTVPVGVQGPYPDIVGLPEAILDIMEAQEAVLMVAPARQQEVRAPTAAQEGAPAVISHQRAGYHKVVVIADRGQVLPGVVDTVDLGPAPPEVVGIVLQAAAMVEVPGDHEASVEVQEEGVRLEGVPRGEEAAEEETNSKNRVTKKHIK